MVLLIVVVFSCCADDAYEAGCHKEAARERHARNLIADVKVGHVLSVDHAIEEVHTTSHLHDPCLQREGGRASAANCGEGC